MKHSSKEIAFQSGLSLATVDWVLHGRSGVRTSTVQRVQAAIRELDAQAATSVLDGQRLAIDVVIEAPERFSSAVKDAFEAELAGCVRRLFGTGFILLKILTRDTRLKF